MVIIRQFIKPDRIEIQVQGSFLKDSSGYASMLRNGFTYNRYRRLFLKTYFDKEYIDDYFQRDVDLIKDVWQHYQLEVFKLINHESNTGGKV